MEPLTLNPKSVLTVVPVPAGGIVAERASKVLLHLCVSVSEAAQAVSTAAQHLGLCLGRAYQVQQKQCAG